MSKKNKMSLHSYLEILMAHILKWKNQISKRRKSWENTIKETRKAIQDVQEEQPSLTDDYIKSIFEETLEKAKRLAEREMKEPVKDDKLTWDEVFKFPYLLGFVLLIGLLLFLI